MISHDIRFSVPTTSTYVLLSQRENSHLHATASLPLRTRCCEHGLLLVSSLHLPLLSHLSQHPVCHPERFHPSWHPTVRTTFLSALILHNVAIFIPFAAAPVGPLPTSISYYRKHLPSLQQRLSNLYLGAPIPDCTPYMRPQLNPFSQSSQHDQI
jgi:hypothetical protein